MHRAWFGSGWVASAYVEWESGFGNLDGVGGVYFGFFGIEGFEGFFFSFLGTYGVVSLTYVVLSVNAFHFHLSIKYHFG